MRFVIIVKATRESEAGAMPKQKLIAAMAHYHEELAKAGVLIDASGLQPSSKGARIKYSGRKRTIIDSSFTEAKELIAGYTLIQVKSRDPAPHGEDAEGEIEIRQLTSWRTSAQVKRSNDSAKLESGAVVSVTDQATNNTVRVPTGSDGHYRGTNCTIVQEYAWFTTTRLQRLAIRAQARDFPRCSGG